MSSAMKLETDLVELRRAVALAAIPAENKSDPRWAPYTRIVANKSANYVEVYGHDDLYDIRVSLDARVDVDGDICVQRGDFQRALGIVALAGKPKVTLVVPEPGMLRVAGEAKVELVYEKAKTLPTFHEVPKTAGVALPYGDVSELLSRTFYAAHPNATQPLYADVHLFHAKNGLKAVAGDGRRFATTTVPARGDTTFAVRLNRRAAAKIVDLPCEAKAEITIIDGDRFYFRTPHVTLSATKAADDHSLRNVARPTAFDITAAVSRSDLLDVVSGFIGLISEADLRISVHFEAKRIVLAATGQAVPKVSFPLDATVQATEALRVSVAAKFLRDVLTSMPEKQVLLRYAVADQRLVISPPDNEEAYAMLIVPADPA